MANNIVSSAQFCSSESFQGAKCLTETNIKEPKDSLEGLPQHLFIAPGRPTHRKSVISGDLSSVLHRLDKNESALASDNLRPINLAKDTSHDETALRKAPSPKEPVPAGSAGIDKRSKRGIANETIASTQKKSRRIFSLERLEKVRGDSKEKCENASAPLDCKL